MESLQTNESPYFTVLYELQRHYDDLEFKRKRAIDDLNIQILAELQANSFNITEDVNKQFHNIAFLLQKVDIAHIALVHIISILNSNLDFPNVVQKGPDVIETLLWLLKKDEHHFWMNQFKSAVQKLHGNDILSKLEEFKNINTQELEACFKADVKQETLNDYLIHIEHLYIPKEGVEDTEPDDDAFGNNSPEVVSEASKGLLRKTRHFPSSAEVKIKKDPYKTLGSILIGRQSELLKKLNLNAGKLGKVKVLNYSNHFIFNQHGNILKVTTVAGEKKTCSSFYRSLNSVLKASHKCFHDEAFSPVPTSITNKLKRYPNVPKVPWKRIHEIYHQKSLVLCSDEIGPNDIFQGALGNCYFLSALSSLAEQKYSIQRLFDSKGINPAGCYSVWLFDSGEWHNIIIDDFLPCNQANNTLIPRFSKSKGKDIWVVLLEKAYAKLYGNYYITSSGQHREALVSLTGAPVKYFPDQDKGPNHLDNVWAFLTNCFQKKFFVAAAARGKKVLNYKAVGLVSSHGYALLDAREVQTADGKTEKLVKMRNPWGSLEWKGDWSDSSPHWTPELLQSLNYLPKAMDGVFWINLADFDKYFYGICACQVHPEYKYSFVRLGQGRKQNVFFAKIKVDTPGLVYLSANQKSRKYFKGNEVYRYSSTRIILAKTNPDGQIISIVDGARQTEQSVVLEKTLEKGDYFVVVEVDWVQKFFNEIVLTTYAPTEIEMQEEPVGKYNLESLYADIIKVYCLKTENKETKVAQLKSGTKERHIWKHWIENKFGLIAVFLSNQKKKLDVFYKLKINKVENYELVVPKGQPFPIELIVSHGEDRVIIFKSNMVNAKSQEMVFDYKEFNNLVEKFTPEQLKEICKSKGKKNEPAKGRPVFSYVYSYDGGMAVYYENGDDKGTLSDKSTFPGDNLLVNGEDKKVVKVEVGPRKDFLLDVRPKNLFEPFKLERISTLKFS